MLILIEGISKQAESLGWTARSCERCQRVLPFHVFDLTHARTFYFVPVWARTQTLMICDFCGYMVRFTDGTKVSSRWDKRQGLLALVQSTNPALGQVDEHAPPTDTQLIALLNQAHSHATNDNITFDVLAGGGIGGTLGALAGVGFGRLLYNAGFMNGEKEGVITLSILCAFLLGGIGALLGIIWDIRSKYREKLKTSLKFEVECKHLDLSRLRAIATQRKHPSLDVLNRLT